VELNGVFIIKKGVISNMTFTLRTISTTDEDIHRQQDYFRNALMNSELLRIYLTEAYLKYQSWTELDRIAPAVDFDEEINCEVIEDNIIKITMNGHLPFIKKEHKMDTKEYFWKLRDHYTPRLNRAIQRRNPNISFSEKAFVLIMQYFPNDKIRDLDNQFKSFIFNSLRSTQIVKDDRWQSLSYMDVGLIDRENSRTEIYVTSFRNIQKLLSLTNIII
jgi:hypothetical protein